MLACSLTGTLSPEEVGVGAALSWSAALVCPSINLSTWFFQMLELEEKEKSGPELRLVCWSLIISRPELLELLNFLLARETESQEDGLMFSLSELW